MSDFERRLEEDRVLRDAALGLFKADLALIRADLNERTIAARIRHRIGESTLEMVDEAVDYTEHNGGKVTALVAAVIVWFARGPIIDAISRIFDQGESNEDDIEEPRAVRDRSRND